MSNVLDQIVAERRKAVAAAQIKLPLERVKAAAERRPEGFDRRDFADALRAPGLAVIAELKQASPSRGILRTDYRPREIAQGYEAAGAAALSVLTEEAHFQGSLTDLVDARDATSIPVLRKDFIVDPYQVYETAASGADALLLIVASLSDADLRRLIELAARFEVAALVEVHNEAELDRALAAGATIVGVNNRDLRTFEVSLDTSFRLRRKIPAGCLAISESGIATASDLRRLHQTGFDAVLIGERLITAPDPGEALAALLGEMPPEIRSGR